MFAVDQSQSMGGGRGETATDPGGVRFQAVKYAIESLRLKGSPEQPHRVGLVEFGTEAPADLSYPVVPATSERDIRRIETLLRPRNLVWTNFSAALERAAGLLDAAGSFSANHRPAVVVLTDGTPEDPRKLSKEQYFSEIEQLIQDKLTGRGCSVYLVAVDTTGHFWPEDRAAWERTTGGRAYSVADVAGLKEKFNDIVRDILQLPELPKDELKPGQSTFEVGPYLDQLEFHNLGDGGEGLRLLDPSGRAVVPELWQSPDYRILTVLHPAAGRWTYELPPGSRPATIYRNEVPVRPALLLPRSTHPAGKALRISAQVHYADGTPLIELPEYPVRVTARVTPDSGQPQHLTLRPEGGGKYASDLALTLGSDVGPVAVDVVLHAGTSREYTSTTRVTRAAEPYFEVFLQSGGLLQHYSDFLSVTAELRKQGAPVAGEEVFQSPTAVIRAQLTGSPGGENSQSVWLDPVPGKRGTYAASIPTPVRRAGRYTVTYEVGAADASDGRRIEYSEPVTLQVTPTWIDRALVGGEVVAIVLLAIAGALAVVLLGTVVWALRLKRMPGGTLVVSYEPAAPAPRKVKTARTKASPNAGLGELLSGAASAASPSTPSKTKPVVSRYRLSRRFLACRPGRFFFVYGQGPARLRGKGAHLGQTDLSKQVYVIRYFRFPFIFPLCLTKKVESGSIVKVDDHTLSFT
ncbi:MAG: vWA domain-containing protein [Armatimonadota bacterium]